MLKENWRLISRVERLGDFIIVIAAFFLAYYGRESLLYWDTILGWQLPFRGSELAPLKDYFIILIVALISYGIALSWMGAYTSMRLSSAFQLIKVSVGSSIVSFMVLSSVLFLLKIDVSRSFIALFCILAAMLLTLERYLVLEVLRFWRRRGRNFRTVIICGVGEQALQIAEQIRRRPELGLRIRAFSDLRGCRSAEERLALEHQLEDFRNQVRRRGISSVVRILVGPPALERALTRYAVDEIIFSDLVEVMPQVQEVIMLASEQGIRTTVAADLFSIGMVKSGMSYFGDMPFIHYQTPPGDQWELTVKRAVDLVGASLLLLLLAPLLLIIALALKFSSPGPVLFAQRRMGLNGRLFSMYKFRSMYMDAESRLAALRPLNEMNGPVFKMKNDPRVTPLGRLLRRFSLDELPQFWNVLIGDMSLVGPRPPVPGEVSLYERRDRRRLSMRPGMTCTWQVSGRNNISDFESWVRLDLEYIDNWSLWRDFLLMLRTIPAVIFGQGAR